MVGIVTSGSLGIQSSSALVLGSQGLIGGNPSLGRSGENVYVNAATGNLFIQSQDELLMGQGLDASIQSSYNSQGLLDDDNGDNWRPSVDRKVTSLTGSVNTAGSTVVRIDSDGSELIYTYNTSQNAYVLNDGEGAAATLSYNSATSLWTWTSGDHLITETYDGTHGGRITASSDLDGNSLTYSYNTSGLLTQVATASGESTFLDYTGTLLTDLRTVYLNSSGQSTTLTRTHYTYDSSQRLNSVIVDLTPSDNSIADNNTYVTTYGYDGTSDRVNSITQTDGTSVTFAYTNVSGSYRVTSMVQTSASGVTRTTSFSYNTSTRQTTIVDPLNLTTVLTYDASGRLTQMAAPVLNGTTNAQQVLQYTYDTNGDLLTASDGKGNLVTYQYDAFGNQISQADALGNTVTRTFGTSNQLLTSTSYLVPAQGTTAASSPLTTSYVYDSHLNLRYVVTPSGRVTEYRYNAAGEQTSAIQYTGVLDAATGTLTEAIMEAWVAAIADKSQELRTDTTYDFRGNVTSTTSYSEILEDGTGNLKAPASEITTVRYVYSQSGQLLQRFPTQESPTQSETYVYDGLGRIISATDALGHATLTQYGDSTDKTTVTLANGLVTTSAYDLAGDLIGVTQSSGGTTLSQTQNLYDADGRLRESIDPTGLATYYLYDEMGRAVGEIDPNGRLSETVYDLDGQVIETIVYATTVSSAAISALAASNGSLTLNSSNVRPVSTALDHKTWNFYDAAHRLTATETSIGEVTSYAYDGASRMIATTQYTSTVAPGGAPTPTANASTDRTTTNFYDNDGILVGSVGGTGYLTTFVYDAAGQLTQTIQYATRVGRPAVGATLSGITPVSSASDIHTYRFYDGRGLLRSMVDGDGYLTNYAYDEYGNLTQTISGGLVNVSNITSPQTVAITFQAAGTAFSGTWPTVQVYVDGVLAGSVTVNSSSLTTYTINASNLIPIQNHSVSFYLSNGAAIAGAGPSLTFQNATFGARPFVAIGDTTLFDAGALPTDGVGVSQTTNLVKTLAVTGALTWTVDGAETAQAWATTPTVADRTVNTYNAEGQLLTTTRYLSGSATEQDSYSYDAIGDLLTQTNVDRTGTSQYNAQGWLVAQMDGNGSAALAALGSTPTQAQINAVWATWGTSYTYDAAGRRTSMTDPDKNTTLYYYNSDGLLADTINGMGEVVDHQYDEFGQLTTTTIYQSRLSASTLSTLTGGLVNSTLTSALSALAAGGTITNQFSYNADGEQIAQIDGRGYSTSYSYNTFGQVSSSVVPTSTTAETVGYTYDQLGNQLGQTRTSSTTTTSSSVSRDAFGRIIASTDGNNITSYTSYDNDGRIITVKDGLSNTTSYTYDAFANVLSKTDALGNKTTFSYTAFNRQITTTTAGGITTVASYNAHGQEVSLVDGDGVTTLFSYDLNGNLLSEKDASGSLNLISSSTYDAADRAITTTDARGIKTAYTYDAAGRTLTETLDPTGLDLVTSYQYDTRGDTISITDHAGIVTTTSYDNDGNAVLITEDAGGTGHLNLQTQMTYDPEGRILTQTLGYGTSAARTVQYTYDGLGRRLRTIVNPGGLALTTSYTYDKDGNVLTMTDANNYITSYVYDGDDNLVYSIDTHGNVKKNTFDADGNLVGTTTYAKNWGSQSYTTIATLSSRTVPDADDETTRFVYDANNRLEYTINALGYVTENVMDGNGNVVQVIQHDTAVVLTGSPLASAVANAITAQVSPAGTTNRVTTNVYDAANRLVFTVDPTGTVTQYKLDADGNTVARITYNALFTGPAKPVLSDMTTWVSSAQSLTKDQETRTLFDNANRAVYRVDQMGYVVENRYNTLDQLVETIEYSLVYTITDADTVSSVANKLSAAAGADVPAVTQYGYDSAGRCVSVTNAIGSVTEYTIDAAGETTDTYTAYGTAAQSDSHVTFDGAGRKTAVTAAFGTTVASETQYFYDGVGNVTRVIDARGNTTYQFYDALGNNTETEDALGNIVMRKFDAFSNLVRITDALGNIGYSLYDQLNRCVATIDPAGYLTMTTYTFTGQPQSVTRYSNAVVGTVNYEQAGGLTPHIVPTAPTGNPRYPYVVANAALDTTDTFSYDKDGRLLSDTDGLGFVEQYTYDSFGDRITFVNKGGATTSYGYNLKGQKTSELLPITTLNSGGASISVSNLFSYDARGNLIQTIESAGSVEQRTTTYTYDLFNRVVAQSSDTRSTYVAGVGWTSSVTPTQTTTYDAQGNVIQSKDADGHITYTYYDALNRKTAQVSPVGTLSTWSYDANGNVLVATVYGDAVSMPPGSTAPSPVNASNYRQKQYTYDVDNRVTQVLIPNMITGAYNAAQNQYQIATGSITSTTQYNADGQVVLAVDFNGNKTFTYYNKIGQVLLTIDPMGYGVAYTHDQNGNVLTQTKFATPYSAALLPQLATTANATSLITAWAHSSQDRITTYKYDSDGRMLSQSLANDSYTSISSAGALTSLAGVALTSYTYDRLSDLLSTTDAEGDVTNYSYDALGRKTEELLPSFVDNHGTSVRNTIDYVYNGLSQLVKQIQRNVDNSAIGDEVTTYTYGIGGLLNSKTDAQGQVYSYGYDAVGNQTITSYVRFDPNGTQRNESQILSYDAGNRQITQQTVWTIAGNATQYAGDITQMQYDTYGEVTGRAVGGGGAQMQWQQISRYDANGRAWLIVDGTGVAQAYFYDANGNATQLIESQSINLTSYTQAGIVSLAEAQSNSLSQTLTFYDADNRVIDIVRPTMTGNAPAEGFTTVSVPVTSGNYAAENISFPSTQQTEAGGTANVPAASAAATFTGAISATNTVATSTSTTSTGGKDGTTETTYNINSMAFAIPTAMANVTGNWSALTVTGSWSTGDLSGNISSTVYGTNIASISVPINAASTGSYLTYTVTINVTLSPGNQVLRVATLSKTTSTSTSAGAANTSAAAYGSNVVRFASNDLGGIPATSVLYTRSTSTWGNWTKATLAQMTYTNGSGATATLAGFYAYNTTSMPAGGVQFMWIATNSSGSVLRRTIEDVTPPASGSPSGTYDTTSSTTTSLSSAALQVDNTGTYAISAGLVDMYGLRSVNGTLASSITVEYRPSGSKGAYTAVNVGASAPGQFSWSTAGLSGSYDVLIALKNASGTTIDNIQGTFSTTTPSIALTPSIYIPTTLTFGGMPVTATQLQITYTATTSGGTSGTSGTVTTSTPGTFVWPAAALVPNATLTYGYNISYIAYDQDGMPVAQGTGSIVVGDNPGSSSATLTGSTEPNIISFVPTGTGASAASLQVYYAVHLASGTETYTEVALAKLPSGAFKFNATAAGLVPSTNYDYYFDSYDSSGKLLGQESGTFVTAASGASGTQSNVAVISDPENGQINRKQTFDAFGDVVTETDGNGDIIDSSYDVLGDLIQKKDLGIGGSGISVMSAAGVTSTVDVTTNYSYNRLGQMLGVLDPNGNLNTQSWNEGVSGGAVAEEFHADHGTVQHVYDAYGNLSYTIDALGGRTDNTYNLDNELAEVQHQVRGDGTRDWDKYSYDSLGNRISDQNSLGTSSTYYDYDGRVVETVSAAGRVTQYSYAYLSTIASDGGVQTGGWVKTTTEPGGTLTMVDLMDAYGRVTQHTDLGGHVFVYNYDFDGLIASQTSAQTKQNITYAYYGNGYLESITDHTIGTASFYEYDNNGNRTLETYSADNNNIIFESSTITFNAENWATEIKTAGLYDITYAYDANGNRREVNSVYTNADGQASQTQTYYYTYDSMNRFTITQGELKNGAIDANDTTGVAIQYDAAGNRKQAIYWINGGQVTETYTYTADGYLANTYDNGSLVAQRINNLEGQVTQYLQQSGGSVESNVTQSWDADNFLKSSTDAVTGTSTVYTLNADGTIASAAATTSGSTVTTSYTYVLWDSRKQSKITIGAAYGSGYSAFSYDANGHLLAASDPNDERSFVYWNSSDGQILRRDEILNQSGFTPEDPSNEIYADGTPESASGVVGGQKDAFHTYYYYDGHEVGDNGNDGIETVDYAQQLAQDKDPQSSDVGDAYKRFTPVISADFDENYQPINSQYPPQAPSLYTVRAGDTLQSIAAQEWGDSTMWYLIADANGLSGSDTLVTGMTLTIPDKVANIHNNAGTFKPYDPGQAIGDTNPVLPDPPPVYGSSSSGSGGGCGGFGELIVAVVAVVATIYTAGLAAGASGFVDAFSAGTAALSGGTAAGVTAGGVEISSTLAVESAAIGGAVGSVASQVVGNALGVENGFSFANVALGALGAAAGAEFGAASGAGKALTGFALGNPLVGAALGGGVASLATQSIASLTGAGSFSWQNVAIQAIGSGIGEASGNNAAAGAFASGLAGGAISGGSLTEKLPGIIGSAIGTGIVGQITSQNQSAATSSTSAQSSPPTIGQPGNTSETNAVSGAVANGDTVATGNGLPETQQLDRVTVTGSRQPMQVPYWLTSQYLSTLSPDDRREMKAFQTQYRTAEDVPTGLPNSVATIPADEIDLGAKVSGNGDLKVSPTTTNTLYPVTDGRTPNLSFVPLSANSESIALYGEIGTDRLFAGFTISGVGQYRVYQGDAGVLTTVASDVNANTIANDLGLVGRDAQDAQDLQNGASPVMQDLTLAARQTAYLLWNVSTLGFLGRSDARQVALEHGQITQSQYWTATGIDAGASVAAAAAAPVVAGRVVSFLGGTTAVATLTAVAGPGATAVLTAGASGAAAGIAADGLVQAGSVANYQVSAGATGQSSINGTELLISGGAGMVVGGLLAPGEVAPQQAVIATQAAEGAGGPVEALPGFCFVGGTTVHTQRGLILIEEVGVGEMVLSQPELGGERAYRRVTETVSFDDKTVLEVVLETPAGVQETLGATPNHPFWVQDVGWRALELVEIGQKLQLGTGDEARVVSVRELGSTQRVFNFTVDGFHTYYVGRAGVWVHNTNCAATPLNQIPGGQEFLPEITLKSTAPQPDGFSAGSVSISDGRVLIDGAPANGSYDYVVTSNGQLNLGGGHYYLSEGAETVGGAGQANFTDGQFDYLNNASGHYQPTLGQLQQTGGVLRGNGLTTDNFFVHPIF